jgi:hypothetical protein
LKNILKHCGNAKGDSWNEDVLSHSWKTPTKPDRDAVTNTGYSTTTTNHDYFSCAGTAEKCGKKNELKNYRGYESEKKEQFEINRNIFSEEEHFPDNLNCKNEKGIKNERKKRLFSSADEKKPQKKNETSYQSLQEKSGSQGGKEKALLPLVDEKKVVCKKLHFYNHLLNYIDEIPKKSKNIRINLFQDSIDIRQNLEKVRETRTTNIYYVDAGKDSPSNKK